MGRIVIVIMTCALIGSAASVHAEPSCTAGFDVGPPATVSGAPNRLRATLAPEQGTCTFHVRLCNDAGASACAATAPGLLRGRGAAAGIDVPDAPGACGAFAEITVAPKARGIGRRRLRATMRMPDGRRRRLRLTLVCTAGATPTTVVPTTTTTTTTTPPTTLPGACTPAATRPCEGVTDRTLGRLVDFPPSLPIASCASGERSSNYLTPPAQLDPAAAAELHVVGVYEGASSRAAGAAAGLQPPPAPPTIDVIVHARPKPVVLALVGYERAQWRLTVEPGATLARVVTSGHETQTVLGAPSGTPIVHRGPAGSFGYFYGWELAANGGGGGFLDGIRAIRRDTGLVESSFQGCYAGARFEIPHTHEPAPDCECDAVAGDEAMPLRDVAFPGCEDVTAESQYCLTSAGGTLALLGIDSGNVCPLSTSSPIALSPSDVTLAWRGEAAYACLYGAGLVRVSLGDGRVQYAQMACGGVAVDDAGRLVVSLLPAPDPYGFFYRALYAFDSWPDVLAGRAAGVFGPVGFLERFTVRGGILYEAWHAGHTIERYDLATGGALDPLPLDVYDGWILGLSVTGDGRLLVPGDLWGDTVWVFDAATGVAEGIVQPTTPVIGLACVDRR